MKTKLATLVATFAAGFQTLAAINSLPIGSVEKVLEQYILHTDSIVVNVKATDDDWKTASFLLMDSYQSYTKADGTEESINALCRRAVETNDKTELKALLEKMMREAVGVSIDPNDPVLQGNVIQVVIGGDWQHNYYTNFLKGSTFTAENYFVLGDLKDAQGNTVIPESAYQTDMGQFISTRMRSHAVFVDGGNIIGGEVRNASGYVVGRVAIVAPDVIGFGNEIISGEQGTVELHYTDGSSQLFSLADGSPLSAPPPPPPLKVKVEVKPYVSEVGVQTIESERLMVVRLTVTGVPPGGLGGRIIIEFCENLSYGYWQNMGGFDNFTGNMFSTLYEPYAQMRFYRARPALPGE